MGSAAGRRAHILGLCAVMLAGGSALIAGCSGGHSRAGHGSGPPATAAAAPGLHVQSNELVDSRGRQVVLHGVNRSGAEFACVQGFGIFDGPADQASVTAMKAWHVSAVRVPLNEACWNSESYVKPAFSGAAYVRAVESYVRLLNASGLVAILDLSWTDGTYAGTSATCGSARALCMKPMPDAAQSIPFWRSVARDFRGNDAVIFDAFNEPFPERAGDYSGAGAWRCWLNGGSYCTGLSYQAAGMQSWSTPSGTPGQTT